MGPLSPAEYCSRPQAGAWEPEEKIQLMKGIQFVVDDAGKKKAVLIDLEEWGEAWENIYDALIALSRKNEPTVDWEVLKAEMSLEKPKAGQ